MSATDYLQPSCNCGSAFSNPSLIKSIADLHGRPQEVTNLTIVCSCCGKEWTRKPKQRPDYANMPDAKWSPKP